MNNLQNSKRASSKRRQSKRRQQKQRRRRQAKMATTGMDNFKRCAQAYHVHLQDIKHPHGRFPIMFKHIVDNTRCVTTLYIASAVRRDIIILQIMLDKSVSVQRHIIGHFGDEMLDNKGSHSKSDFQGYNVSPVMIPFDRPHTISYQAQFVIATMSLYCTVSEMLRFISHNSRVHVTLNIQPTFRVYSIVSALIQYSSVSIICSAQLHRFHALWLKRRVSAQGSLVPFGVTMIDDVIWRKYAAKPPPPPQKKSGREQAISSQNAKI